MGVGVGVDEEWLEIGKIVAPQGLRGEIRVYPNTDFPERFLEPGERWLLRPGGNELESVKLLSGRYLENKGLYVIRLEGIEDREQVEDLRNGRLFVPMGDRPPLEEGEFHVLDLLGLPVYHQPTGVLIGQVKDVIPAGNDLLEVELTGPAAVAQPDAEESADSMAPGKDAQSVASTVLIPFVEPIVPVVDIQGRRIEITPPPGLLPEELMPPDVASSGS